MFLDQSSNSQVKALRLSHRCHYPPDLVWKDQSDSPVTCYIFKIAYITAIKVKIIRLAFIILIKHNAIAVMTHTACMCMCVPSSHWVSIADVFARSLNDGLAGLIKRPVNPVVTSWISRLDQSLELQWENKCSEKNTEWQAAGFYLFFYILLTTNQWHAVRKNIVLPEWHDNSENLSLHFLCLQNYIIVYLNYILLQICCCAVFITKLRSFTSRAKPTPLVLRRSGRRCRWRCSGHRVRFSSDSAAFGLCGAGRSTGPRSPSGSEARSLDWERNLPSAFAGSPASPPGILRWPDALHSTTSIYY